MSRLASLLLVVAAFIACSPAPDTLRVERVLVETAIGQFDPLDRTITDQVAIADLNATVRSLPEAPFRPGAESFCPIAWGHRYRLTFASGTAPTLVAVVEADGCRYAYLGPTDRRATTESFWGRLAGALGYYSRGNDLFPLPRSMRR